MSNIELRHQDNGNSFRLFLIRTPNYGTNLDVYNNLFEEAKKYFPNLNMSDVAIGYVQNTGFIDHHAVITFTLNDKELLPNDFKKLVWKNYFKWTLY